MSTRARYFLSVGIAIAVFLLLWPTFFFVAYAPAALLGVVIWLASGKNPRTKRFREFALTGSAIGFVGGGVGMFLIIRLTGWGTSEGSGWEDFESIIGGMMGAAAGGVVGLGVGFVASLIVGTKREPKDGRS